MNILKLAYTIISNEAQKLVTTYVVRTTQAITQAITVKYNELMKKFIYQLAVIFISIIIVINLNFGIIFLINHYAGNNYFSWLIMGAFWLLILIVLLLCKKSIFQKK